MDEEFKRKLALSLCGASIQGECRVADSLSAIIDYVKRVDPKASVVVDQYPIRYNEKGELIRKVYISTGQSSVTLTCVVDKSDKNKVLKADFATTISPLVKKVITVKLKCGDKVEALNVAAPNIEKLKKAIKMLKNCEILEAV